MIDRDFYRALQRASVGQIIAELASRGWDGEDWLLAFETEHVVGLPHKVRADWPGMITLRVNGPEQNLRVEAGIVKMYIGFDGDWRNIDAPLEALLGFKDFKAMYAVDIALDLASRVEKAQTKPNMLVFKPRRCPRTDDCVLPWGHVSDCAFGGPDHPMNRT